MLARSEWPLASIGGTKPLSRSGTPSTFQFVVQYASENPSPEKGDLWDSTAEVEAIGKVALEGGHHNDARDHQVVVVKLRMNHVRRLESSTCSSKSLVICLVVSP